MDSPLKQVKGVVADATLNRAKQTKAYAISSALEAVRYYSYTAADVTPRARDVGGTGAIVIRVLTPLSGTPTEWARVLPSELLSSKDGDASPMTYVDTLKLLEYAAHEFERLALLEVTA